MHARGGIAGELDPVRFERVKLRVNDGARERDEPPIRAAGPPGN